MISSMKGLQHAFSILRLRHSKSIIHHMWCTEYIEQFHFVALISFNRELFNRNQRIFQLKRKKNISLISLNISPLRWITKIDKYLSWAFTLMYDFMLFICHPEVNRGERVMNMFTAIVMLVANQVTIKTHTHQIATVVCSSCHCILCHCQCSQHCVLAKSNNR